MRCRSFPGIITVAVLTLGSFSVDGGCTLGDALVGRRTMGRPRRPEIGSYQNFSRNCRVSASVSEGEEGTAAVDCHI